MPIRLAGKAPGSKRIYLVEDHPTFREGLVQILNGETGLSVCGEAGTAAKAIQDIARLKPDLVLVDITLPGKSGLEMIKELRKTDKSIKLLVLSMHDEALYASRVLRAGGDGYIMKQEDPDEIIQAIRDVLAGHIYVSENVLASLPGKSRKKSAEAKGRLFDQLTDTELEILAMLGRGKSEREVARELHLDIRTIESRCAEMKKKLNLKGDNALMRYAVCWVETGAT